MLSCSGLCGANMGGHKLAELLCALQSRDVMWHLTHLLHNVNMSCKHHRNLCLFSSNWTVDSRFAYS